MATCRVCGGSDEPAGNPLLKYSTRHYAHAACGLQKWGSAFFDRLHDWQVRAFPYLTAARAGFAGELDSRCQAIGTER